MKKFSTNIRSKTGSTSVKICTYRNKSVDRFKKATGFLKVKRAASCLSSSYAKISDYDDDDDEEVMHILHI